jgi:hypothetical protein
MEPDLAAEAACTRRSGLEQRHRGELFVLLGQRASQAGFQSASMRDKASASL